MLAPQAGLEPALVPCLGMISVNLSASSQSFQGSAYFFWNRGSVSPPQVLPRLEIPLGKVSPDGVHQLVGASKTPGKDQV